MTPTDVGSPEAQDVDVFIAAPAGPQSRPHHRLETRGLWRLRGRGPSLSYLSFFFSGEMGGTLCSDSCFAHHIRILIWAFRRFQEAQRKRETKGTEEPGEHPIGCPNMGLQQWGACMQHTPAQVACFKHRVKALKRGSSEENGHPCIPLPF